MALRSLEINSKATRKKLPITIEVLRKIQMRLPNTYNETMMWAVMTLAHFGLLRAAEFTVNSKYDHSQHLSLSDISFHVDKGVGYFRMFIKRSKTDKHNKGFSLYIGCSDTNICAYCAMNVYYQKTATLGKNHNRPLFIFQNGVSLSRALFVSNVKMYLALAGIDPRGYSGHSFRIGGATTAAAAGLADWEIKILGRWSSDTYQRYIRTPTSSLIGFAKRMTTQHYDRIYNMRNPYVKNIFV
jgi:hypothetical protein